MAEKKWLATWEDDCGMPRAWGSSANKDLAKEEAKRQLDKYIEKKRGDGEVLTQRDFKLKCKRYEEK